MIISLVACFVTWRIGAQEPTTAAQRTALARAQAVIAEELGEGGTDALSDADVSTSLTSFKGCKMRYRKISVNGGAIEYRVSLAELDPESVRVGYKGRHVTFAVANRARKIEVTPVLGVGAGAAMVGEPSSERPLERYASTVSGDAFRVRDQASAIRLQDALVGAVKACQAQP
jgi:hypothetical protein